MRLTINDNGEDDILKQCDKTQVVEFSTEKSTTWTTRTTRTTRTRRGTRTMTRTRFTATRKLIDKDSYNY